MSKSNVSVSESITSASSVGSIFRGSEGTLFDELRAAKVDIEMCFTNFKEMHRRFQKEGRTPSNAMDRRDCDALQMNIVMQLTSL